LLVRPRHVAPQNVRIFIEQNRQMTRADFAAVTGDQSREAVRVNEGVDRLSVFYTIKWRDVHQFASAIFFAR
jgi:hypothetical protein